ncbi:hypothetical protein [Streptomyces sp. NBC_00019]|uniref:hypothetical protein n=1 Tax=Streptomyces sp. NBC_00019 TaxID=2975623 RepID=UPI003865761A
MGTPEHSTTGGPGENWAGRVSGLAGSCHPGPVVAVTALMAALAVTAGQSVARCALTAAAVLSEQLSVGWCNDAFDARRDIAAGRHGKPAVYGTVGVTEVWVAAYAAPALCVPLSIACGLWAGAVHLTGVAAWAYDRRLKATAWSWAGRRRQRRRRRPSPVDLPQTVGRNGTGPRSHQGVVGEGKSDLLTCSSP